MPLLSPITLSSCTPAVTDVRTSLASSAVGATTPNATEPACTLSTIPSATCSSGAPGPPFQATPFTPAAAPPQHFGQPPGGWGPMPNYYRAPAQPYPISYPPGLWPPYQQYYAGPHGHSEEGSKNVKPNKFTCWDPSKLRPFIVSCIMAFDSWPHKFVTDCQR